MRRRKKIWAVLGGFALTRMQASCRTSSIANCCTAAVGPPEHPAAIRTTVQYHGHSLLYLPARLIFLTPFTPAATTPSTHCHTCSSCSSCGTGCLGAGDTRSRSHRVHDTSGASCNSRLKISASLRHQLGHSHRNSPIDPCHPPPYFIFTILSIAVLGHTTYTSALIETAFRHFRCSPWISSCMNPCR